MQMHIAVFTDIYRPRIGGTTVSVVNTVRALREAGAETTLFAPSPDCASNDTDTIFFATFRLPLGGTTIRTAFPYSPRIGREFRAKEIDVIHSFSPFFVGIYALQIARYYHIPIVFTYQTRYAEYLHFLPLGKHIIEIPIIARMLRLLVIALTRQICNSFDCVIVPTETIAKQLREYGVKKRIEVIPVGFDLSSSERTRDIRKEYEIPSEGFVLLHVGRLSFEKNVQFLIRSFSIAIKKTTRNLYLVIVGDGPERHRLEQLALTLGVETHTTFIGAVPNEKMGQFYEMANCFIFSSLTDTQAFVISESLISGLPIVAIRAPGPEDFISNGVEGLLTDPDEQKFANAIITLAEDSELCNSLSKNAKTKGQQLTLKSYGVKLVKLYSELAR